MSSGPIDLSMGVPLPSEGLHQAVAFDVKLEMRQLIIECISDKVGHAWTVASGPVCWRDLVMKEFGPMFGNNRVFCHEFANTSFECIRRAWIDKYGRGYTPGEFLDAVHIPKPLSAKEQEAEIDDAWEIEIGSDQRSMEANYEGSARVRKGPWLGERPTPRVPE